MKISKFKKNQLECPSWIRRMLNIEKGLLDAILRLKLDIYKCRAQADDGSATMKSAYIEVAKGTSTAMQVMDVTMENRNTAITGLKKYLSDLRTSEAFLGKIKLEAADKTSASNLARPRKKMTI